MKSDFFKSYITWISAEQLEPNGLFLGKLAAGCLTATVNAPKSFEGHATVLVEMLRVTTPTDNWKQNFRALLARFPEVNVAAMGFGPSWAAPYWQP